MSCECYYPVSADNCFYFLRSFSYLSNPGLVLLWKLQDFPLVLKTSDLECAYEAPLVFRCVLLELQELPLGSTDTSWLETNLRDSESRQLLYSKQTAFLSYSLVVAAEWASLLSLSVALLLISRSHVRSSISSWRLLLFLALEHQRLSFTFAWFIRDDDWPRIFVLLLSGCWFVIFFLESELLTLSTYWTSDPDGFYLPSSFNVFGCEC